MRDRNYRVDKEIAVLHFVTVKPLALVIDAVSHTHTHTHRQTDKRVHDMP